MLYFPFSATICLFFSLVETDSHATSQCIIAAITVISLEIIFVNRTIILFILFCFERAIKPDSKHHIDKKKITFIATNGAIIMAQ